MSHYYLDREVIVQLLFFIYSFLSFRLFIILVTLGHCIADPVTRCSPTIRVHIQPKNTATAIYFQTAWHSYGHWVALARGVVLVSQDGFQRGGIWFSTRVKIKTSCFFSYAKRLFEQFIMPPKRHLRLIDILQIQIKGLEHRTWFAQAKESGWQQKTRIHFCRCRWKHQAESTDIPCHLTTGKH